MVHIFIRLFSFYFLVSFSVQAAQPVAMTAAVIQSPQRVTSAKIVSKTINSLADVLDYLPTDGSVEKNEVMLFVDIDEVLITRPGNMGPFKLREGAVTKRAFDELVARVKNVTGLTARQWVHRLVTQNVLVNQGSGGVDALRFPTMLGVDEVLFYANPAHWKADVGYAGGIIFCGKQFKSIGMLEFFNHAFTQGKLEAPKTIIFVDDNYENIEDIEDFAQECFDYISDKDDPDDALKTKLHEALQQFIILEFPEKTVAPGDA